MTAEPLAPAPSTLSPSWQGDSSPHTYSTDAESPASIGDCIPHPPPNPISPALRSSGISRPQIIVEAWLSRMGNGASTGCLVVISTGRDGSSSRSFDFHGNSCPTTTSLHALQTSGFPLTTDFLQSLILVSASPSPATQAIPFQIPASNARLTASRSGPPPGAPGLSSEVLMRICPLPRLQAFQGFQRRCRSSAQLGTGGQIPGQSQTDTRTCTSSISAVEPSRDGNALIPRSDTRAATGKGKANVYVESLRHTPRSPRFDVNPFYRTSALAIWHAWRGKCTTPNTTINMLSTHSRTGHCGNVPSAEFPGQPQPYHTEYGTEQ
ncbi:hypothetical protein JHW43_008549 [Diplocarpon mali]|nr:hypothetical protein JHW43_008549 [Diplocarpon mali]